MKLLLDQGTPRSAAALLREEGIDAVHTGEIGMANAGDAEIIERAVSENRMVITLDADFHSILALAQATKPSVVRIRLEGLKADEFVRVLHRVLAVCRRDMEAGALISVRDPQIRIRRLPVA